MHPLGPIGIVLSEIDPEATARIVATVWPPVGMVPVKPLDADIAAAPALDRRNGAKDLRVRSPFEKEAERLKLAKYFTEKGTQ